MILGELGDIVKLKSNKQVDAFWVLISNDINLEELNTDTLLTNVEKHEVYYFG